MLHNNILYNKYNIVQSQQGCNHDGTKTIVYLYIDIFQGIVFYCGIYSQPGLVDYSRVIFSIFSHTIRHISFSLNFH